MGKEHSIGPAPRQRFFYALEGDRIGGAQLLGEQGNPQLLEVPADLLDALIYTVIFAATPIPVLPFAIGPCYLGRRC